MQPRRPDVSFGCRLRSIAPVLLLILTGRTVYAQSSNLTPARWQASYTPVYTENFEGTHSGIQLLSNNPPGSVNYAIITTDPSLVIAGTASARLGWFGKLVTVPSVIPLVGNSTYIV